MTVQRSADPSSIRQWNEYLVFEVLRDATGPLRISDLSRMTGLTAASLGHLLRGLESKGWVVAAGAPEQRRGRPAQVFSLREQKGYVLGLDLGVHAARALRMALDGTVVVRAETRFDPEAQPVARAECVRALLEEVLDGVGHDPIWHAGVAHGRDVDLAADYTPDESGRSPHDVIGGLLPSNSLTVSDARASTWAEHVDGAAKGYDDVLMIHLGWRPSIGLLVEGKPHPGAHGHAGHLQWGSLLPGVEQMHWPERLLGERHTYTYEVVTAAREGDPEAVAAAKAYMTSAAPAAAFATALVDPAVVVLGGAFSPIADLVLDSVSETIALGLESPPDIVISQLDQFSAAQGAAHLARQQVLRSLVSPNGGVVALSMENLAESSDFFAVLN